MSIVNCRPPTVSEIYNPDSLEPLTPNHILTGKSSSPLPPPGEFLKEDMYISANVGDAFSFLQNSFGRDWDENTWPRLPCDRSGTEYVGTLRKETLLWWRTSIWRSTNGLLVKSSKATQMKMALCGESRWNYSLAYSREQFISLCYLLRTNLTTTVCVIVLHVFIVNMITKKRTM